MLARMLFPTLCILWVTYYFVETAGKPASAQYLIRPVCYALWGIYALIAWGEYKKRRGGSGVCRISGINTSVRYFVFSCLYILAMPLLGMYVATPLFLGLSFAFLGERKGRRARRHVGAALIALIFSTGLCIFFERVLLVPLPRGIFGF